MLHLPASTKTAGVVGLFATGAVIDAYVAKPNLSCLAALSAANVASVRANLLTSASDRTCTSRPAGAPTRTTSNATTANSAFRGQVRFELEPVAAPGPGAPRNPFAPIRNGVTGRHCKVAI